MDMEGLKTVYALSEEKCEAILDQVIKRYTYRKNPVAKPKVIIIGAQPGAGKTELQKVAELELLRNAVICNADNFRDFHPMATEIKRHHEQEYPTLTADYAHRWNRGLMQYCRENNLNYILETTFSSGNHINDTIQSIKDAGYQVDVKLLAVNSKLSLLGVHSRFEAARQVTGHGRVVSKAAHDIRFMALSDTIQKTQAKKLYDNIQIYARSIVLDRRDLTEGVTLVARNPIHPLAVWNAEINRKWPDRLHQYFKEQCQKVLNQMTERMASPKEMNDFKKHVILNDIPAKALTKALRF